ncbi:3-hydroxyacyl-CoA dehydrogenase NAD-binding domain-containing protein [Arcobacter sp. CECT 8985]|uniref:3-hydroxyacyl-CoA dehydrogenase NAD-binding domain-containing protein n=1 Tax=Arcobacter sp. CECT 8985 TaxID=1935424 RepID=UPI00100AC94E|nr:3-hydroxyacyl-CoA dehydrogenase NAD-binding domain-containing protein [Arcobacter sp. CECT 8985]RXJ88171.1 enoyl-CoA hydratase [Arcobacter sp. CECT 8985]
MNLNLEIKNNIATLYFDLENEKVNKLSFKVLKEFDLLLDEIIKNRDIDALIIKSLKENIFIAGADIHEIKQFTNEDDAYNELIKADNILNKLENLKIPTIAYINGACMGGGLELALACKYRVATTNSSTKFAFPEIKLGFFPGIGGTQRAPKLIGLINAMDLILTGKTIDSKKAFKLGLIDDYFDKGQEDSKLNEFINLVINQKIKRANKKSFFEKFTFTRDIIFKKATKNIESKVNKNFAAPYKALEVLKQTYNKDINEGLKIEASTFSKLAVTKESKYLIELFFLSEKIKKDYEKSDDKISTALVVGNGVMGKGIIWLFSKYLKQTRIKLRSLEKAHEMINDISKLYDYFIKSKKMSQSQVDLKLSTLSYTQNFDGLQDIDLVIEAIIENEKEKKDLFLNLEKNLKDTAIIASNTSSISIEQLSKNLKNKENFMGIHFFNPVNKMPLVEIIPNSKTSTKNINKVKQSLISMGKMPIVVNDCAGFLVNRILLPYLNEAAFILEEGSNITTIDNVLKEFGMPMGPFTLADNVGIDIGFHVSKILNESYGERMPISNLITKIYNEKLFGKKTKKGFYDYSNKNIIENNHIYNYTNDIRVITDEEIRNRTIFIMINEASRCLEENIVSDADIIDFAMIAGTGFPPFRGGLLKYANYIGIKTVVKELKRFEYLYNKRFEVSNLLLQLEQKQLDFKTGETLWKH